MKQTLLIAWLLVSGTVLSVLPWSIFWPRVAMMPDWLAILFSHPVTRGAISGLGLILLLAGLLELHHATSQRS